MNKIEISKLKKLERIGEGSFGEVYLAIDEETNEFYAVKVFRNEFNKGPCNFLPILHREIKLFSKLNHPAILRFIAFSFFNFDDDKRPAIITQYAPNKSLDQIFQIKKEYPYVPFWNNTVKLCIIYGVSSAMSYLHKNNIVHLDLKPANILLDEYLLPLICDFGLAEILDNKQQSISLSTLTGVRGTATHIAPEIWKNQPFSFACDVYSFALVLYSILTDEEPFENYNQYEFFTKVIHNGERPNLDSKIPEAFKQLIRKCWSEDPKKRPDFSFIVQDLAENQDYIMDDVDVEKYHKYIQLINQYQASFSTNNNLGQHHDIMKNHFEKVNIEEEINNESEIDESFKSLFADTIEGLNELPQEKQETIKRIIYPEDKKFNYKRIDINSAQVNDLYNDDTLDSTHMINILKFFKTISIEVQFPSDNYDSIMRKLASIKKNMKRIIITNIVSNTDTIDSEFKNNTIIDHLIINSPVSTIAPEAFRGCIFLKSAVIPPTVTEIGTKTFSICEKLEKVTIQGNLREIGVSAFRGNHMLTSINIPSSCSNIGKSCFRGDNHLEHIKLPESLISINKSVFKSCVLLKELIIPPHVTLIETGSFEECVKLSNINIPPSVEVVEDDAFKCCVAMTHMSFDPTKTTIRDNAFRGCRDLTLLFVTTPTGPVELNMKPFPNVKQIIISQNVVITNPIPSVSIIIYPLNTGILNVPLSLDSIGQLGIDSYTNS
ncbi:hypothetical protein M9Y10_007665 [Tritrichomonas musculus]|uniref:Protein kinase domain-containing protein n=1 Tax=Tritrichomonas musculus TaxID=1915356 RepID=A0ABR2J2V9_9EUKA